MIHITMGPEKSCDPETEHLHRDRVGYREGMSQEELYYSNHGTWVIGRDRRHERYAVFAYRGQIKQALEIHEINRIIVRDDPADRRDDRCVIEGTILRPGHPVHDAYVDKPSPLGAGRNPVRYFDSPFDVGAPCRCGCGEIVAGKDFLPGHDQTALHARVAQIGTVAQFLDWFDIVRGNTPPQRPSVR